MNAFTHRSKRDALIVSIFLFQVWPPILHFFTEQIAKSARAAFAITQNCDYLKWTRTSFQRYQIFFSETVLVLLLLFITSPSSNVRCYNMYNRLFHYYLFALNVEYSNTNLIARIIRRRVRFIFSWWFGVSEKDASSPSRYLLDKRYYATANTHDISRQ